MDQQVHSELAGTLTAAGHPVSDDTVGRLLKQQGYRLQRTVKTLEGAQQPDRDAQFRYLNEQAKQHLAASQPVVGVDAKKGSWSGAFPTAAVSGSLRVSPNGSASTTPPIRSLARRSPMGSTRLAANSGWVSVGVDHDTAAFAVATLRRWWQQVGSHTYPEAERLMVCANAGGSNGYRVRAWKTELARLAAELGLQITVCHLPPGDLQVEPDRASIVQRDLDELARPAAGQP